jgi:hypothetical protein
MGDLFQRFLNAATAKYKEADRATGGWLPGGGVASPLTRAKQEEERKLAQQYQQSIDRQSAKNDYVGKPGRFAGQGQFLNALRAVTTASANPIGIVQGNKTDIKKTAEYYKEFPDVTNEYDLNTNMFLRYLSGVGSEGLQIPQNVGTQIYQDIKEQEKKIMDPATRENVLNSPYNPAYIKPNLLKGNVPVYYLGQSEAKGLRMGGPGLTLVKDIGERKQLDRSLGSYWAKPEENESYKINDRYNFGYAPKNKEGFGGSLTGFNPTPGFAAFLSPDPAAQLGRNLVKAGYGTPYTTNLQVRPDGQVVVR